METWYERLKRRREALGLIQAQVKRAVGVSGPTVSDWENGKMSPRGENLTKLCKLLAVTPDWLLYGKGNPDSTASVAIPPGPNAVAWETVDDLPGGYLPVPVYNFSLADGECCTWDLSAFAEPLAFRGSWFKRKKVLPCDCRAIVIHGDAMAPAVCDDDTIVIDLTHTQVQDGGVYAIGWGQELYLRRLFRLPGGGLELRCDNPVHSNREVSAEDAQKIRILGKMVWRGG